MDGSDKREFYRAWAAAFEALGRRPPSPAALDMTWALLRRYELDSVLGALAAHLSDPDTGQYQPKPADIVRHIEGGSDARKASAALAWSRVEEALRDAGSYASVVFDDPGTHRAIEAMGGWIRLCAEVEDDARQWKRQEFERLYLARRGGDYPAVLVGRIEARGGTESPMLFGDHHRCRLVFDEGKPPERAPDRLTQETTP